MGKLLCQTAEQYIFSCAMNNVLFVLLFGYWLSYNESRSIVPFAMSEDTTYFIVLLSLLLNYLLCVGGGTCSKYQ